MTRFFYDCEFLEDGKTIELISIGVCTLDGREYYAVNGAADWWTVSCHPFLAEHVLPQLPISPSRPRHLGPDLTHPDVKSRDQIRAELLAFLTRDVHAEPELWGWCCDYDHVVLAQLYGPMARYPGQLPKYSRDIQQEIDRLQDALGRELDLPQQTTGLHNALEDAKHVRRLFLALDEIATGA